MGVRGRQNRYHRRVLRHHSYWIPILFFSISTTYAILWYTRVTFGGQALFFDAREIWQHAAREVISGNP